MNGKAKKARREYLKQWRQKNPERIRKYTETYWTKKAEEMEKQGEGCGAPAVPSLIEAAGDEHGGRAVDV